MLTCARWAFSRQIASVTRHKHEDPIVPGRTFSRRTFSRRTFLQGMRWAPVLFLPAPCWDRPFRGSSRHSAALPQSRTLLFPSLIFASRHTTRRSLRWMMCFASYFPARMSTSLRNTPLKSNLCSMNGAAVSQQRPPISQPSANFLMPSIEAVSLLPIQEIKLRSADGIDVFRRRFARKVIPGRERLSCRDKNLFGWDVAVGDG